MGAGISKAGSSQEQGAFPSAYVLDLGSSQGQGVLFLALVLGSSHNQGAFSGPFALHIAHYGQCYL